MTENPASLLAQVLSSCPFMIKKMAKVKCFKSSVLPHIWYIAEHGPEEIIKDLFEALPKSEKINKVA